MNELFTQGSYNFQNLRNETLAIADHKHVNIFKVGSLSVCIVQ